MRCFVAVVEKSGFARAAEHLNLSTSVASRMVSDLEAQLGTRLLHRTTRKLSLTESGAAYFERCVQILTDLDEAERAAGALATEPRGTLKITCSIAFGIRHLAPAVGQFQRKYSQVAFDVSLSDRFVDLIEEGFDLAVRIGNMADSPMVARKIGETRMLMLASPEYLKAHGTPKHPSDLAHHNCFTYAYSSIGSQWALRGDDGEPLMVKVAGSMHANSGELLAAIAAEGGGISMEPDFIVADLLEQKRLVEVLPQYSPLPMPIYAVYPSRRHLSAKVRVFVDFLAAHFAERCPPRKSAGAKQLA